MNSSEIKQNGFDDSTEAASFCYQLFQHMKNRRHVDHQEIIDMFGEIFNSNGAKFALRRTMTQFASVKCSNDTCRMTCRFTPEDIKGWIDRDDVQNRYRDLIQGLYQASK